LALIYNIVLLEIFDDLYASDSMVSCLYVLVVVAVFAE